jgi:hypothetical protein
MQVDRKTFKRMFPYLIEEMDGRQSRVNINKVKVNSEAEKKATASKSFDNYMPDIIDFLCRCDTPKQAEEIIDYMEKRSEIDYKYAQKLRAQLNKKGIRSFGAKREEGYYLAESGNQQQQEF